MVSDIPAGDGKIANNESIDVKMPNIHYIDVKSNEKRQQDITGLTSL